jgi:transcription termination/antitermination protein NusG
MQYYTIHVLTDEESDFERRLLPVLGSDRLIVPKKTVSIRRRGVTRKEIKPVFPGYVFLRSEDILKELDIYWKIRRTDGFIRFLKQSPSPTPLSEADLSLLSHFISFGECADTSKVTFDENDRIVVLEGPLKGLEGRIDRVDRRKKKARIVIDMCKSQFHIFLGFEVVERIKSGGGEVHGESRA